MIDIQYIKELINLMRDSGLTELELHHHNSSIKLSQRTKNMSQPNDYLVSTQTISPTEPKETVQAPIAQEISTHILKSPMVGTFYRAASPQKAPFVNIGQPIKKGDIIGIIEAMKILNHIQADKDGVVKELLINDGAPVEYEQPLLTID